MTRRTLTSIAFVLSITCAFTQSVIAGADQHRLVPNGIFQMATRVAVCEEGGWSRADDAHGSKYYGNLGWLDATWQRYKMPGFPPRADEATPQQQARAMLHFVTVAEHGWWPDQYGCHGY
jgi:hypothetical protein